MVYKSSLLFTFLLPTEQMPLPARQTIKLMLPPLFLNGWLWLRLLVWKCGSDKGMVDYFRQIWFEPAYEPFTLMSLYGMRLSLVCNEPRAQGITGKSILSGVVLSMLANGPSSIQSAHKMLIDQHDFNIASLQ